MEEVKRLINGHGNRDNLLKLLKDKTSLIRELGDDGKKQVEELKEQLRQLLEQMRFPDGRTLKELVTEKQLRDRLHKVDEVEEEEEKSDSEDEKEEEEEDKSDEEEEEEDELIKAAEENFKEEKDKEEENKGNKDEHERDMEVERMLKHKQE